MTDPQSPLADVGVTGLATMGRNLARNLASRGHRAAVHVQTGSAPCWPSSGCWGAATTVRGWAALPSPGPSVVSAGDQQADSSIG